MHVLLTTESLKKKRDKKGRVMRDEEGEWETASVKDLWGFYFVGAIGVLFWIYWIVKAFCGFLS